MLLYLVRHAIAVPRPQEGSASDADRELTPEGRKKMRRQAAGLAKLEIAADEIWTSPLVRARQTADILAEALGRPVHEVKALEPGSSPDRVLRRLQKHPDLAGVALVGHEPDLGELAMHLMTASTAGAIQFKKGGAACIEVDDLLPPVRGRLCWLLTPRQLRVIAG